MYDLGSLSTKAACDAGAAIELVHPITKVGLGQFIHVVGRDSTIFHEHENMLINEARQRKFEADKRGEVLGPTTIEHDEAAAIELLVKCTIGFSCKPIERDSADKENAGGKFLRYPSNNDTYDFNEDNVRKLYRDQRWIRMQADRGIADLRNFIKS